MKQFLMICVFMFSSSMFGTSTPIETQNCTEQYLEVDVESSLESGNLSSGIYQLSSTIAVLVVYYSICYAAYRTVCVLERMMDPVEISPDFKRPVFIPFYYLGSAAAA